MPTSVRPRTDAIGRSARLEVYRDAAGIPAASWDDLLVPGEVQLSHRFVSLCQESGIEDVEYWHVLAYDGDIPVGIASLFRMVVAVDLLSAGFTRSAIRAARVVKPSFMKLPVLFCGLPVSFGQPCLRIRQGTAPSFVLEPLTGFMEDLACAQGIPLLCFKEFSPSEIPLLSSLKDLGYFRAPSLSSCQLTLRWSSFDDYLGSMRSGYRRQLEQCLERGRQSGLTIRRVEELEPHAEAIFRLYGQVMARAEFRLERLPLDFFRGLAQHFRSSVCGLLVERQGELVATAVLLFEGPAAAFLLAGIDYRVSQETLAYPNLVTEIVREAIRSGATRLDMGQTSYELKTRMGAEPVPRCIYLRSLSPLIHRVLKSTSGFLFPQQTLPARRVFRHH